MTRIVRYCEFCGSDHHLMYSTPDGPVCDDCINDYCIDYMKEHEVVQPIPNEWDEADRQRDMEV